MTLSDTRESVVFRKAAESDMEEVLRLQTEIFSGEQNIPAGDIAHFLERRPQCWIAVMDGAVVGAAAAWEEDGLTHWGRFVMKKECRGQSIGTRLAEFSFRELFSQPVDEIYMEAREITRDLVCGMGGRVVGEPVAFYRGTITPVVLRREDFLRQNARTFR